MDGDWAACTACTVAEEIDKSWECGGDGGRGDKRKQMPEEGQIVAELKALKYTISIGIA